MNLRVKEKSENSQGVWKGMLPFLYALFILFLFYPYEFYSAFPLINSFNQRILMLALIIITFILSLLFRKQKTYVPTIIWVFLALQFFGFTICYLAKGKLMEIGILMPPLLALSLVAFLSSTSGLTIFFKRYNLWILLMVVMGTTTFFLLLAGKISPLYMFIDFSDDEFMYNWGLTFSQHEDIGSFHFCGFFDEPGAIAIWSIYALLFNKLFIKDGRIEWLLMILPLFTFSLGFFAQETIYFVLFYLLNKNEKKARLRALTFLLAVVAIIFAINALQYSDDNNIYERTIGRFLTAFDDSKTQGIAIDDREESTNNALQAFLDNPLFGATILPGGKDMGNNMFEPLAYYGIIGTFFLLFPYLFMLITAFIRKDQDLLKCIIIMISGFAHRPFHPDMLQYFILYSFVALYFQQRRHSSMPRTQIVELPS